MYKEEVKKVLIFNGGLTLEQVEKLRQGASVIYEKIPYKKAYAPAKNTFDYVPKELYHAPLHIFRRYISENCYLNQYIFFGKSLQATFEFCNNSENKNYIMVCDIEENILNQYIGVGNYGDYRVEYRLPRAIITPDKIKEVLFFEPYNKSQMEEFKKKYSTYYFIDKEEDTKARNLMLEKKLEFNGNRNWL